MTGLEFEDEHYDREITLTDILRILWRRRPLILFTALIFVCAAAIYSALIYLGRGEIKIYATVDLPDLYIPRVEVDPLTWDMSWKYEKSPIPEGIKKALKDGKMWKELLKRNCDINVTDTGGGVFLEVSVTGRSSPEALSRGLKAIKMLEGWIKRKIAEGVAGEEDVSGNLLLSICEYLSSIKEAMGTYKSAVRELFSIEERREEARMKKVSYEKVFLELLGSDKGTWVEKFRESDALDDMIKANAEYEYLAKREKFLMESLPRLKSEITRLQQDLQSMLDKLQRQVRANAILAYSKGVGVTVVGTRWERFSGKAALVICVGSVLGLFVGILLAFMAEFWEKEGGKILAGR